ncbi:MAG: hypothetical protein WDW36_004243 [Sanguina aurantia]
MGRVCTPLRAAPCQQQRGASVVTHAKKGLHPEYFSTAKVVCNGQEVMVVGGTKPSYNVDIYSGNHPFYQGNKTMMILDDGQLNKFTKRFADLDEVFAVSTNNAPSAVWIKPVKPSKGKGRK